MTDLAAGVGLKVVSFARFGPTPRIETLRDFVADGRDGSRRDAFRAGTAAIRTWERARPLTLDRYLSDGTESFAEALTYFPEAPAYRAIGPDAYLEHIFRAKQAVNIPVIASLNGDRVRHRRRAPCRTRRATKMRRQPPRARPRATDPPPRRRASWPSALSRRPSKWSAPVRARSANTTSAAAAKACMLASRSLLPVRKVTARSVRPATARQAWPAGSP